MRKQFDKAHTPKRGIGREHKKARKLKFRSFEGFLNFCKLDDVVIIGELRVKGKIFANIVWGDTPKTVRIDHLPYKA